jgi:hypothetical protein
VVKALLQAGMSLVRDPMRWMYFSIYLILPAALSPGVYSASNRNEYHKHKNNASRGVERSRSVELTTLPASVCQLSGQYGIP